MKAPLVTIVVTTYRRLGYLRQSLPSALGQSFGDFEVIVSDDGASDEIAGYVASLGDSRVRYRRNEKRLGIAMNNQAAFLEARGKYIATLHDDDFWEPGFLSALVPPLEADGKITVAFCDHSLMDEQGRLLPAKTEANSRNYRRDVLAPGRHQPFLEPVVVDQTIPMVMAAVFRKSILEGTEYPKRIGLSYDHWLSYLAVKNGQAVYYVPERLTRYRIHENSGTAWGGARYYRDAIYVRSRLLADPGLADYRSHLRNGLGMLYGKLALYCFSRGLPQRGGLFVRKAFTLLNRPKNMVALAVNVIRARCKGKVR